MCTSSCLDFVKQALTADDIAGKRVLEVGSYDVNGTIRPHLESYGPAEYIGVDIVGGPGVDFLCNAEDLLKWYGPNKFDVVLTTEMLEHVRDWRTVIHNLKQVLKPGGVITITTRSPGFPMHGYPYDFWRYTPADMRAIFADFAKVEVQDDAPHEPGVFVRAIKPADFHEADMAAVDLYSVLYRRRVPRVSGARLWAVRIAWGAWRPVKDHLPGNWKLRIRDRMSRPPGR